MFKVVADPEKNRLYITLSGHFEGDEKSEAAASVIKAVEKLQPGFDVINDISDAMPTDEGGLDEIYRVRHFLFSKGVRHVIRITKLKLTGLQLDRVARPDGYTVTAVDSMEQAERFLETAEIERKAAYKEVRSYKRISVGPEHTIRFVLQGDEYKGIRIVNLSAEGCFAVLPEKLSTGIQEGALLHDFVLEHADLPSVVIDAKVIHIVRGLSEISARDIGFGINFTPPSQEFTEWINAYVMAFYGLGKG